MIGRLVGTVVESGREAVVVDVRGVGYEVFMTARDLAALPPGTAVTLVIETVVREDLIRLYGFREAAARDWFRLLQSVQGVGAKVALAVLTVLAPNELARAVALSDIGAISRANGVGKRVAERIAGELKDKGPAPHAGGTVAAALVEPADEAVADAVSALVNLGYDEGRAREAVGRLRRERPEAATADLIRGGLKALAA